MDIRRSDIAFTPAVKHVQVQRGSRDVYAQQEEKGDWAGHLDSAAVAFLTSISTGFLGTAASSGQPYVQHRGGPPGFIRILDERTFGFADFVGNRQYISTGNLSENPQAFFLAIDYRQRRRLKLWGRAMVTDESDALGKIVDGSEGNGITHVLLFQVWTLSWNCPKHIPVFYAESDVERITAPLLREIALLRAEIAKRQS